MEAFADEGIFLESVEVLSSRDAYEYSLQTKVLFPDVPLQLSGTQKVPLMFQCSAASERRTAKSGSNSQMQDHLHNSRPGYSD